MIRIAAMGDNVVDCYISKKMMFPGGNCLNVSVFARRLGAVATYIGAIGRDPAGKALQGSLAAEGVLTDRLRVLPGSTAYCIIGHNGAERVFLRADLGVSMFQPDHGDLNYLKEFDVVHVGQSSGLDDFIDQIARSTRLSYDFSIRNSVEPFPADRPALLPCFGLRGRIGPRAFGGADQHASRRGRPVGSGYSRKEGSDAQRRSLNVSRSTPCRCCHWIRWARATPLLHGLSTAC